MKRLLPLILIGCLLPFAAGDVIHLKDGTLVLVPIEKVASIEVKAAATPEASLSRLASLRRAVENIPDIKTILDRYQSFITQNAGTPAADKAKADMEIWQDRQNRGLVRVGSNWVTPQEQAEVQRKMLGVADQLRVPMKAGRVREAGTVLERALADDP